MGKTINFSKHIWEGWTVQDFIDDLAPVIEMIQTGNAIHKVMTTKDQMKVYCMSNQPYYKKYIPDVVNFFCQKYNIKA